MPQYSFAQLQNQIKSLVTRYPFLEAGTCGDSVMGKPLYYLRLGQGPRQVFYNGAHHANEWITTLLLMRFIENYAAAYQSRTLLAGYSIAELFAKSSIYIVPMVNPDGVDLVNYSPNFPDPVYQAAASLNTTGLLLPRAWKANIRGVDLNLNYPALWEKEKQEELKAGINRPGSRDFCGFAPLSEPESQALVNFTRGHDFQLVIAYHTQGREIYYQFNNIIPPSAPELARSFATLTGYTLSANPVEASYAGYKDWFIQEYHRPGFTVEVGYGVNPIPARQLEMIYRENEKVLLQGAVAP